MKDIGRFLDLEQVLSVSEIPELENVIIPKETIDNYFQRFYLSKSSKNIPILNQFPLTVSGPMTLAQLRVLHRTLLASSSGVLHLFSNRLVIDLGPIENAPIFPSSFHPSYPVETPAQNPSLPPLPPQHTAPVPAPTGPAPAPAPVPASTARSSVYEPSMTPEFGEEEAADDLTKTIFKHIEKASYDELDDFQPRHCKFIGHRRDNSCFGSDLESVLSEVPSSSSSSGNLFKLAVNNTNEPALTIENVREASAAAAAAANLLPTSALHCPSSSSTNIRNLGAGVGVGESNPRMISSRERIMQKSLQLQKANKNLGNTEVIGDAVAFPPQSFHTPSNNSMANIIKSLNIPKQTPVSAPIPTFSGPSIPNPNPNTNSPPNYNSLNAPVSSVSSPSEHSSSPDTQSEAAKSPSILDGKNLSDDN